jgi:hypothetical protein
MRRADAHNGNADLWKLSEKPPKKHKLKMKIYLTSIIHQPLFFRK